MIITKNKKITRPKNVEDIAFSIDYIQNRPLGDSDIYKYITINSGKIKAWGGEELWDEDWGDEEYLEIGEIDIKIFNMAAMMNHGVNPVYVFDLYSQDIDIYTNIFDKKGEIKKTIEHAFEHNLFSGDILVIESILIKPEWRGCNITKMIIEDLYLQYSESCKFIMLKAFPLQFQGGRIEENMKKDEFIGLPTDLKKASSKLISFYKDLGFVNIPRVSKEFLFL